MILQIRIIIIIGVNFAAVLIISIGGNGCAGRNAVSPLTLTKTAAKVIVFNVFVVGVTPIVFSALVIVIIIVEVIIFGLIIVCELNNWMTIIRLS